jgi:hypothetical protein
MSQLGKGPVVALQHLVDRIRLGRGELDPLTQSDSRVVTYPVEPDAVKLAAATKVGEQLLSALVTDFLYPVTSPVQEAAMYRSYNRCLLEFTVDHPDAGTINEERRRTVKEDLARWLGGDHKSNNTYR